MKKFLVLFLVAALAGLAGCGKPSRIEQQCATLRRLVTHVAVHGTDAAAREKPGMILDFDADGNVVGIEIMDASQRVSDPRRVDFTAVA